MNGPLILNNNATISYNRNPEIIRSCGCNHPHFVHNGLVVVKTVAHVVISYATPNFTAQVKRWAWKMRMKCGVAFESLEAKIL